jgi:serine/threonine protein kinase
MTLPSTLPLISVDCLSLGHLPSHFSQYIIPHSSYTVEKEFPSPSTSKTSLIRLQSGHRLIFKPISTSFSSESYYAQIASLFSLRFFFLSPVEGFSATPPFGFFYSYHENVQSLHEILRKTSSLTPLIKTLIAAFLCYGMAYLEANAILHGTFHSQNIFLTRDFLPVITDWGLTRTYDFFAADRSDELSWIAPELLLSVYPNYSSDMYSFGALLFEMHEGRRPFNKLTNKELLVGLRYQKLRSFDFEKTVTEWRELIRRCTDHNPDMRPSFCEIFYLFQKGSFVFPGANSDKVKLVLSKYPMAQLFSQDIMPILTEKVAKATLDPQEQMLILMDCGHPQFREICNLAAGSVSESDSGRFCDILARHLTVDNDPSLGEFLIVSLQTLVARGSAFYDAALKSSFFRKFLVRTKTQSNVLLELLKPIFLERFDAFQPAVFQSIAGLFLYRPTEILNLFSNYFIKKNLKQSPTFWDNVRFFLGFWSLLMNSSLGQNYISTIRFLITEYPEFYKIHTREILGILTQFLTSSSVGSVVASGLILAQIWPDGLILTADALILIAREEQFQNEFDVIFLSMKKIPDSPVLVNLLIARAVTTADNKAWILLMKYVRQGDVYGLTVVRSQRWLPMQFREFDRPFRLLLCVFLYPNLRAELGKLPDVITFFKKLCVADHVDWLHILCSLLQRLPIDENLVKLTSETGLLQTYLAVTLESTQPACVKYGILLVDTYARVGYVDEWVGAVHVFIGFLRNKFKEFGTDVVKVISTLSPFPPCMRVMKDSGLVEYYQGLLQYREFASFAQYFLNNASRVK